MAISAGLCEKETSEEVASKLFIQSIKDLNKNMGIGNKLLEIQKDDIEELAKNAEKEANPVYPVPILMDKEKLQEFYYKLN